MGSSTTETEMLLAAGRPRSAPGKGFKAKVDGKWQDYAPHCHQLLMEAYQIGCPSMRLNVQGHMYKFDFVKMEQKNLNTLEANEMRAPHNAHRPQKSSIFRKKNLLHPLSKGRQSVRDMVYPQRPVFVVRVPAGSPGTTIQVPHPKKLGKAMTVAVPAEAEVGQPLYLPVPRTQMRSKLKYAAAGTAVGTTGAAVGVAVVETTGVTSASAGGLAAGGALATAGTFAAATLGGVAVAGAVVAAGAGVHYAIRNPRKAAAIGALTIGGLAFIDHAADVGVVEAVGDIAEGVGDIAEGAGDFVEVTVDVAEEAVDAAEDAGDFILDAGDWVGDVAEDGVDIILDLF